jgi:hypothetical protein
MDMTKGVKLYQLADFMESLERWVLKWIEKKD